MKGSLLGYSDRKFKASSVQVPLTPIFFSFLITLVLSSCGFVDDAGEGVNTPPMVSVQTGDLTVNEQSPVTLSSSVTDDFASIASISWEQVGEPQVQLQNANAEQASFTAPEVLVHESPAQLEFRVTVRDNFGQESSDTVVVLVNAVNTLPVANDDSGLVVNEGQPGEAPMLINVTENDSDGDGSVALAGIKIVTIPRFGQAIPNDDGTVSYVHDGTEPSAELGTDIDSFTYRVKDNETVLADEDQLGEALIYSNEATVSVAITPVNDAPVAETAIVTLDEGQTADGLLTASDPDSDIEFFLVTEASLGAVAVTDSGAFTYVPNDGNVNGTDQFTFGAREVGDEELESTALVSVTINPVNDAPQITSRAVTSVQEESPYVYDISAADAEGDGLAFSSSSLPAWLTLKDNGNGTAVLSGTPSNNDAGSYNITVRVTDNGSPSQTGVQTFTIRVAESNVAPRFTSNAVTSVTEGQPYTYNVRTTDPNGDALTITAPTLPSWLSFTDNGDGAGVLSGTPGEDDAGNHNVTLRVIDNGSPALSANQSFVIVVGESNEEPRFTSTAVRTATEGQPYTYSITATDPDDDELTISAPTLPDWLDFTDNGNGRAVLSGTPGEDDAGNHNVTLRVTDDGTPALVDNQSFTIVVSEANEAPRFTSNALNTAREGEPYSYSISATDPDGDAVRITAPVLPGWLNLNDNGAGSALLSGMPGEGDVGSNAVTLRVTDGGSPPLSADQSFTIIVTGTNEAPQFTSNAIMVATEGEIYTYSIVATDPDGDALTIEATALPLWLTFTDNGNGTALLNGTPGEDNLGVSSVSLQVSDNGSPPQTATQSFSITVSATEGNTALRGVESDCWTTPQEQPLQASLSDPEASPLAMYSLVSDGTKGAVTITDPLTGAFRYDPDPEGERGADTFTYRIDDPNDEVKVETATVIIHPKIMFLGDSITAGISDSVNQLPLQEQRGGFRKPFYDALIAEGYNIDLVGSQSDGSALDDFDPQHEARSDWTTLELAYGRNPENAEGVFAWLEANPADILLIHAGSYGFFVSTSPIVSLLDEIDRWEASTNGHPVTVVVARIINQNPSDPNISLFNDSVAAMISNRASSADPDRVLVADLYNALSYPDDLSDQLHPNEQGYAKLADAWKNVLMEQLLLQKCP